MANSAIKVLNAHPYYDIFQGDGWSNHTRVRRIRTDKGPIFKYVNGNQIHPKFINEILHNAGIK